ncbi:peptide-methionine (R)-S-oxide reductase MsrB [Devosia nitrariae]|uniref:peptide-methionine (R)-S-oxide reductase n=1 Tax=Devosia nitrariae TaxID=2071872 RepID=A0ABQ5W508_9HYPH|nr:peptide-methionine (R)-S-oxide reductase MsrB [Devosia nitrariae]GLQ54715.1 peptide-methionine (R)-S-oxide reductase [Devosia nitrariae]
MKTSRRSIVLGGTAAVAVAAVGLALRPMSAPATAAEGEFEFTLTDAEWQARLSPEAYQVLRHEATERPWTSPLLEEKRAGTFLCAGCDLPLFASETKYDSGTGWPSFYDYLPGAIGTTQDTSLFMVRTEVHCARCGGHQGHVFEDGPEPTGLRYCINGLSLKFEEA